MHDQNRYTFLKVFLFVFFLTTGFSQAQERCKTHEWHHLKMQHDPQYRTRFQESEQAGFQSQHLRSTSVDTTIIIPVVVHILYNNNVQNLSDEQVQSQIDILNEDFAALNASVLDVPGAWTGLVKDSKIRFKLAQQDLQGNRTSGITRTSTSVSEFILFDPAIFSTTLGGQDAWPRTSYLNLWVCNLQGNALGFAAYPGSNAAQDGVVINYRALGRKGTALSPYNFGRTSTHEIGHWLVLNHIWGDDNDNCLGKDFPLNQQNIDDTPNQASPNFRCPRFPKLDECSTSDPGIMYMNYMDYTDDKCMMFFTPGQIFRMRQTLDGTRDSIQLSQGHLLPSFYTKDAAIDSVLNPVKLAATRCLQPQLRIRNNGSDTLTSLRIHYGLYEGLSKNHTWSGTILPGATELISLPEIGTAMGNQVMEFRLLSTDDNPVNNYMSAGFKVNVATNSNCSGSGLTVYPNPVSGQSVVYVRSNQVQSQQSLVRLYNALGQLLFEESLPVNAGDIIPLELGALQAGVYFVSLDGDAFIESTRFIYLPYEKN
ncbi:MAG: T9SS type A sorting domain-containing protein [Bacteroidia bacterium]|nr:T9SS type A sorting domain-containing protein [Bacteroidia bacterium]